MTKVLITGGAGFIGSNLAALCLARGYEVRVLDNLATGLTKNLEKLEGLEFMRGDAMDPSDAHDATKDVQYVFAEGAVSTSADFFPDPTRGITVNEVGFVTLMKAAATNGVRKVVYPLSSRMYGTSPVPSSEHELLACNVVDVYCSSLLNRLYIARQFEITHMIRNVGLVYFSVYGPNLEGKGQGANIVQKAIWEMKKGQSPTFFGDGTLTRDLIHVQDVAEANLLAAESFYSSGFVNVGTGIETSMNELGSRINLIMGTKIPPAYEHPPYGFAMRQCASTSWAAATVGFRARVSLSEGLRDLIRS